MTAQQRERVIELLLCGADACRLPYGDPGVIAAQHLGSSQDDMDEATACLQEVNGTSEYTTAGQFRIACLEAAQRLMEQS